MARDIFKGKELNKSVNPDEVVAIGAAIQGAVLEGQGGVKDILLLDVTPLSLGIETLGGVMTKLIDRNTTIPTSKKEVFSTASDNQTQVEIHVLQGEREFARDNGTLGRFSLAGIPASPRGLPQIEVEFNIDANGILHVSATDKASNKSQKIEIKGSSGLDKTEVERMKKEAEAHAAEDRSHREIVDQRNQAEQIIYQTRHQLEEHGDKVSPEVRGKIESAINDLEGKLKGDDATAIKRGLEQLQKTTMELGKAIYEKMGGAAAGEGGPGAGRPGSGGGGAAGSGADASAKSGQKPGGDDVIDAEYEVKE
jgi:molecular chaperone DnaK